MTDQPDRPLPDHGWRCAVENLNFPTSIAARAGDTADGDLYIAESGLPWGSRNPTGGRVWKIHHDGSREPLRDGLGVPLNGLTWHPGTAQHDSPQFAEGFYLAEGGKPGKISHLGLNGEYTPIRDKLPGGGNYQTCMVAVGPDARLYFAQGALTNAAIVGLDALQLGWLRHLPHPQDKPGFEIELTGLSVETDDPFHPGERAHTGAFAQFGERHPPGTRLPAELPCTAGLMSMQPDGSDLRLEAWGLRNAYGIGFLPDGRLIASEQGCNERGSRPIGHAPECLYEIKRGAWYGWPDFIAGRPVSADEFMTHGGDRPAFVLANHDQLPPLEKPLIELPVNASALKFAVIPKTASVWPGQLLLTLFGDERPLTGPELDAKQKRPGRELVRIDPRDWSVHPLPGPAALKRPIDVHVSADGRHVHLLDFGHFEMTPDIQVDARPGSGCVWQIELDQLS